MKRPSWDKYFMDITDLVSTRSTCIRRRVGAVVVKDKQILATGYNGAPSNVPHCLDIGCLRDKMNIASGERQELCRGIHAEQNCIVQAAKNGISLKGGVIYITNQPCITCSKLLINVGIEKIIYRNPYPDELALQILKEAGIEVEIYTEIE
ncbi:MAG: cytidine deaminase [Fusobacteria bacterium]|nr:cytidine deaminase [Fusobacteriota bacterium]